ncbi:hypothetical protein BJ170DRAFT_682748 [Xylariales sp. AK1849]|nr:hypothetical protein BJ170DRAFT_682748 [Xylariales sp. AK1849]
MFLRELLPGLYAVTVPDAQRLKFEVFLSRFAKLHLEPSFRDNLATEGGIFSPPGRAWSAISRPQVAPQRGSSNAYNPPPVPDPPKGRLPAQIRLPDVGWLPLPRHWNPGPRPSLPVAKTKAPLFEPAVHLRTMTVIDILDDFSELLDKAQVRVRTPSLSRPPWRRGGSPEVVRLHAPPVMPNTPKTYQDEEDCGQNLRALEDTTGRGGLKYLPLTPGGFMMSRPD